MATAERLFAKPGEAAMVAPTARSAIRMQKFLTAGGCQTIELHDLMAHGTFAVTFPAQHSARAKLYWQHCGEIVSSRLANSVLDLVIKTCYENSLFGREQKRLHERDSPENDPTWAEPPADCTVCTPENANNVLSRRTSAEPAESLRRRVAALAGEDTSNTFVYPTGMAAVRSLVCVRFFLLYGKMAKRKVAAVGATPKK